MRYSIRYILIFLVVLCGSLSMSAQNDRTFIRMGNRAYHNRQWSKAETFYRKSLARNNRNSQAVYNLGCALMQQGKDSLAVIKFLKAAKLESNPIRRAKSYYNIGVMCEGNQKYAPAINYYEECLRNNPSDNQARYNLVLCKKLLKNNPKQNKKNKDNKNKNNNKDKNKNKKDNKNKNKQNKNQNNPNKNKSKQNQNDQGKMSKDNADQLLNAAIQQEKATKQKMQRNMSQPRTRNLNKNW